MLDQRIFNGDVLKRTRVTKEQVFFLCARKSIEWYGWLSLYALNGFSITSIDNVQCMSVVRVSACANNPLNR